MTNCTNSLNVTSSPFLSDSTVAFCLYLCNKERSHCNSFDISLLRDKREKGTKIKRYPDNLLPKTSLEVSRTLLVFRLQLVSIGGQQPFQRMPDDDQLVVSRQHSFYFGQGIVGEPLKGTWRMRLISRYFHRIITWPFPRGHHQNSFPVRARNLIHESVDLE